VSAGHLIAALALGACQSYPAIAWSGWSIPVWVHLAAHDVLGADVAVVGEVHGTPPPPMTTVTAG